MLGTWKNPIKKYKIWYN